LRKRLALLEERRREIDTEIEAIKEELKRVTGF